VIRLRSEKSIAPFQTETRNFSLPREVQPSYTAKQTPYSMVTAGFFLGVRRKEREADPSPTSTADVQNGEVITLLPPYAFIAWTETFTWQIFAALCYVLFRFVWFRHIQGQLS
jgi:hypothetical protein